VSDDNLRSELTAAALKIRQLAEQSAQKFVFAESCTSGLAAAVIGSQPGISEFFCGSHVTYRNDSKHRWLEVSTQDLESVGPVSSTVAIQMAQGALQQTAEAQLAVSITGHLGPESPDGLDGVVFLAAALRQRDRIVVTSQREVLVKAGRTERQQMATLSMLRIVERLLQLIIATEEVCNGRREYSVIGDSQINNVLSGSFNPVHTGHLRMAKFAREALRGHVHFELSVENVDKPQMDQAACIERLLPICLANDVVVTRAPTFRKKARLFEKACFLVGVDTIGRIAESRYYENEDDLHAALQEMSDLEVCFLVFGRTMDASFSTSSDEQLQFTRLEDLKLPSSLIQICKAVDEDQFRQDISSRDLR